VAQVNRGSTSRLVSARRDLGRGPDEDVTPPNARRLYAALRDREVTTVADYIESHDIEDMSGNRVPFDMNPAQHALVETIIDRWKAGHAAFIIIIKPRQIGFSTVIEHLLEEGIQRWPGCKAMTVAHDVDATRELFSKLRYAWDQIPKDMRPTEENVRGDKIRCRHYAPDGRSYQTSQVRLMTARKKQGSRSGTLNRLHLSEYAHWENSSSITGFASSVHDFPGNFLIVETTACGHNAAYDLWKDAVSGKGQWFPFFVAWWEHAPYAKAFKSERERAEFRHSLARKDPWRYGGQEELDLHEGRVGYTLLGDRRGFKPLSLEQLNWRRDTIDTKCKGSLRTFWQEYPAHPDQAFLSTGTPRFDIGKLFPWLDVAERLENQLPFGRLEWALNGQPADDVTVRDNLSLAEVTFVPDPVGMWALFHRPEMGMRCVMGADVAEGLDTSGSTDDPDYSACYVGDALSGRALARFHARLDTTDFAKELFKASRFYGNALTLPEANNQGLAVIKALELMGFDRLLRRLRAEPTSEGKRTPEKRPGFLTTRRSKAVLMRALEEAVKATPPLREPPSYLPWDARFIREAMSFVVSPLGRMGAEPGKHDDLVIARALMEVARLECDAEALTEVPPDRSELVAFLGRANLHPNAETFDSYMEGYGQ